MKLKLKKLCGVQIIILMIISFFCPVYMYTMNKMTITFSLTCMVALVVTILLSGVSNKDNNIGKEYIYIGLLGIYAIIFLIINIMHIGCYWEMFNRIFCFLFFYALCQKGSKVIFEYNIKGNLIIISWISMILSILLYIRNIEELSFAGGISYRLQGQHFVDKRLTYIFNHKSGYGLILILLFYFVIHNKDLFKSKKSYYAYLITVIIVAGLTGSASTWVALCVMILFFVLGKVNKKINRKVFLFFIFAIMTIPYVVYYLYNFLMKSRNLSSGGSRFKIWAIAYEYLKNHSIGLGNSFYSTIIYGVNNFHNVFLNEMLHFSVIIGFLFLLLFICMVMMSFKAKKHKKRDLIGFWIAIAILLMIDESLIVANMPVVFLLIYLNLFLDENEQSKHIINKKIKIKI